ncbi:NAD(P)-binding Rossmann-like domain protein [Bacteriovorax sp. BAL6_X]|uniref:NAD(P)/FAD-dependent oxidoreductase n=1 Tax=Bacteriovorax sp. BAL6_X TaxID=1201290 RepID=UPI0003859B1B|nr:FAD-dependent oxidoreductase [Bacteriovorax sp. BAL6_X]EPZ50128.1 NAD(P)-binding Rossmann-like domain protein [Bacteriovorax sp. BAL6_X]
MRIAIIGSGISGLTCAYKLSNKHDITLFEANDYLGGHTHTHEIEYDDQELKIDTGFIVFNKKTYPHFLSLINELGVEYKSTAMSFSVHCDKTGLEYNGTTLNTLFAQRRNLFRPWFYSMINGIIDFNKKAKVFLVNDSGDISLSHFFETRGIRKSVIDYYIVPMMAAVWSTDPVAVWRFPAKFVLRFFENHGFLEVDDRPQWYVIEGGSNSYIKKMVPHFKKSIRLKTPVKYITREKEQVIITTKDGRESFDQVIIATHSDTALKLLESPTNKEIELLSAIPYVVNPTYLHTDDSFLPKRELAIAAWNYLLPTEKSIGPTVTYNMNILQGINFHKNFNVTLNPYRPIEKDKILKEMSYMHPLFTLDGMKAQARWHEISGHNRTHYCGAYWRNGFHEDGVFSALRIVEELEKL